MATTHETHGESTRLYWVIAVILAVITIVEVLVTFPFMGLTEIPLVLLAVLLILSFIKGSAVVMFFMHLKGDARVFKFLFIAPFLLAVSTILIFKLLFSVHVGIAG